MARLNISIPTDLAPLVSKWRRKINLSEICAMALRSELGAVESHRSSLPLLRALRQPSELEHALSRRYGLNEAWVMSEELEDSRQIRESLGALAADYLMRNLCDGSVLALGGGRQTWCMVEHTSPRQLDLDLLALGYRQADPYVLNAHPNTLITILWLLFSPKARARLVGSDPQRVFKPSTPVSPRPRWFIVGSCAPFHENSPLSQLLGPSAKRVLVARRTIGDFLYNFFDCDGQVIDLDIPCDRSILSAPNLRSLCQRSDTKVILVAGGDEKTGIIRKVVEGKLCNVLITEAATAQSLLTESQPAPFRSSRQAVHS